MKTIKPIIAMKQPRKRLSQPKPKEKDISSVKKTKIRRHLTTEEKKCKKTIEML